MRELEPRDRRTHQSCSQKSRVSRKFQEDMAPTQPERLSLRRQKPAFQMILNSPPVFPRKKTLSERVKSVYYGYAKWLTRDHGILTGLRLTSPPDTEQVVRQSKVLCREYIYNRLRKLGMLSLKLEMQATGMRPTPVSREIQCVGSELETMYPYLYKDISRQLNMTMTSDATVRKTIENIADLMFKNSVITWGRIVAMFAVAGAFAADSVSQGHPEFVNTIVDTFADITKSHLARWISKQGGWSELTRAFRASGEAATLWALTGIGALAGFFITLALTL